MAVAVLGSINMDITAYLERLPRPGETLHGRDYKIGLGGKGANQAVAVRRLGGAVRFIARTGADFFGDAARRELACYTVDLDLVARDEHGTTGIAIISVDQAGENFISVIGGVNLEVDLQDVARGRAALEHSRVLLLQLEVPLEASLAAAKIVRNAGGTVILDPAPAPPQLARDILGAVDIVTPNETEAAVILGWTPASRDDGLRAASELRAAGAPASVVKLGAKGAVVATAAGERFIEPFTVEAIDTVAAGDIFNGGLAHALDQGVPLFEAVRFASACGALSTTRKGAAATAPTKAEVDAFVAQA